MTQTESGHGVVRIASVAALGGLLFGYDSAVINGAVDAIDSRFDIHGYTSGFAVASALLGAAAGAMYAGRAADRFGRIFVMKIAAVAFLISAIGAAAAPSLWLLIVFRLVGGVGVGMASVIAPAYIAEVAPAGIRGRLASLQQLAIVLGIFLSQLVNYLIQQIAGGADADLALGMDAWRWMFLVMAVPAVVYGVLSFTIPESPRFLIANGDVSTARRVIARLFGTASVDISVARIEKSVARETPPSWRDLLNKAGKVHPIVWVGLALSIFQQFVGINVIFYYSNSLWQAAGFSESDSFLISMITSVTNIVTTFIAIALVDRFGRRPLLLIGSAGMAVSLAVLAATFGTATIDSSGAPALSDTAGVVALVSANVFVVAFGMSWGPIVWVLLGELFPNRYRAAALALAAGVQWIANWGVTVSFPGLSDASLQLPYWLYTGFAVLSLVFVYRFVRETKGRELEDMDETLAA
ncbi:sugar porter family MFS transporter [Nocardioides sp. Kera G14]|uniref:sugar porter family MFS transporter n=1 Tax=Nocardioides sp. Kera G14 TaxID=2884264 RepID=UPI001D1131FA|nr:sugar porter family MFS transporter [Nocardioides sp. Kera G14]UDY23220.1 sugar porter family MFS transporter [Nocardioides sp. Kera G14]